MGAGCCDSKPIVESFGSGAASLVVASVPRGESCSCPGCDGSLDPRGPELARLEWSTSRAIDDYRGGGPFEVGARVLSHYSSGAPGDLKPSVGRWLQAASTASAMGLVPDPTSPDDDEPRSRLEANGESSAPSTRPLRRRWPPWPPWPPWTGLTIAEAKLCAGCARKGKQKGGSPQPPVVTPSGVPLGDDEESPAEDRPMSLEAHGPVVTGRIEFSLTATFNWIPPAEGDAGSKDCLYQRMKSTMWLCIMKQAKCVKKYPQSGPSGRGTWAPDPGVERRDKNGKVMPGTLRQPGVINGPRRGKNPSDRQPASGSADKPTVPIAAGQAEALLADAKRLGGWVLYTKCSEYVTLRYELPKSSSSGKCILKEKREWWTVDRYKISKGSGGRYKVTAVEGGPPGGHAHGTGSLPAAYKKICTPPKMA